MMKRIFQVATVALLLSGCASHQELKPSEITELIEGCTLTEDEERYIRQGVVKMGMKSCAVIKLMGKPEAMTKTEDNGIPEGFMRYQFNSDDVRERVLIKLSTDKVLSIDVAKLKMFGSTFYSTSVYAYDP